MYLTSPYRYLLKLGADLKVIQNIIDIGSGVPYNLFEFLHECSLTGLTCIDKNSIPTQDNFLSTNVLSPCIDIDNEFTWDELDKFEEYTNWLYRQYVKFASFKKYRLIDEKEFESVSINFHFGTRVQEYLPNNRKYDLIILSKVLENVDDPEETFELCTKQVSKESLIFLRLNRSESMPRLRPKIEKYILSKMEILFRCEEVKDKLKHEVFIGQSNKT
jgi:hypothetical protein